ncbi:SRPBCC domain-containing protein [Nocardiopsis xinjiangensis]|uniref:SRPBCC domain-containing protein n=1 Tax=Nocardiopsis xinjiangensis TaxID=124285 RepID=UPI00034AC90E|nr:SRPBCC domain-containing protein [Nocardiopsis xinjiangensis]
MDLNNQVGAVDRTVEVEPTADGEECAVVLTRDFGAAAEELWRLCTDRERLARWFVPVTGELEEEGTYQVQDNTAGRILACDPPRSFRVTWEFSGYSELEVHCTALSDTRGRLRVAHAAPVDEHWEKYGPAATGIGWEQALLGLDRYLGTGDPNPDGDTRWEESAAYRDFVMLSGQRWGEAHVAAGGEPTAAEASAARTVAFYTGREL